MRRFLALIVAACGCLLLSSCLDIHEEIWIQADGSGHATLTYTVPETTLLIAGGKQELEISIRQFFDSYPEFQLDDFQVEVIGTEARITLRASTDSVISLANLSASDNFLALSNSTKSLFGSFDIKAQALDVDFQRSVDLQRAIGLASLTINGRERSQRRIIQVIHLPALPKSHNASRSENGGRTLIWEHSLGEALRAPVDSSFHLRIPLPAWSIAAILLLITVILYGSFRAIRRYSNKCPAVP